MIRVRLLSQLAYIIQISFRSSLVKSDLFLGTVLHKKTDWYGPEKKLQKLKLSLQKLQTS